MMSEPYTEFILKQPRVFGAFGELIPVVTITMGFRNRLRFLVDGKVALLLEVREGEMPDWRIRLSQFRVRNLAGRAWRRLRSR
jgi:hypothetical protein